MYHGRDMHIMSAVHLRISGKHVQRLADRLARTAGIPDITMGPAQLWKGFVCGNFEPARATTTKCALFARLLLCIHRGAECH